MAIHSHRILSSIHSRQQKRKIRQQKSKNNAQTQSIIKTNNNSVANTVLQTENKAQTKQIAQNPFMQHINDTVNQTKHDYNRVLDSFEKEGATPAVLDGISGTANFGKNTIKAVSSATDTIFECTKTGNQGFDNIVSDGIGKTASGIIGTGAEIIASAGSLFSTEDGSTTKAIENLGKEADKAVKGGGNLLLGIVGKGWIWGRDDDNKKVEQPIDNKKVEQPIKKENEIPEKNSNSVNLLAVLAEEIESREQTQNQTIQPDVEETPKEHVVPVKYDDTVSPQKDSGLDKTLPNKDNETIDLNNFNPDNISPKPCPPQQDVIDALNYFDELENEEKNNQLKSENKTVNPENKTEKRATIDKMLDDIENTKDDDLRSKKIKELLDNY